MNSGLPIGLPNQPHFISAARGVLPTPFFPLVLSVYLFLSQPRSHAQDEEGFRYKLQNYVEEDGRIEVLSHYTLLDLDLPHSFHFSLTALADIITGATPTGVYDPERSGQPEYIEIDDRRNAAVFDLSRDWDDFRFSFQYAYSEEEDYRSNSLSIQSEVDLNEANTTLLFGLAYADDDVYAVTLDRKRRKETYDGILGLSQILGPRTLFRAHLGFGYGRGYLADPYKSIGKTEIIDIPGLPPFPQHVSFFENRPDERTRYTLRLALLHHFEALRGSFDASYRFFHDDAGIEAHTLEIAWRQKFGDRWVVSPFLRYYVQDEADYYLLSLDGSGIEPDNRRSGDAPYYSSDYRLSKLDAWTFGCKVAYFPFDSLSVDATYERYEMSGRDSRTPGEVYPHADTLTLGLHLHF